MGYGFRLTVSDFSKEAMSFIVCVPVCITTVLAFSITVFGFIKYVRSFIKPVRTFIKVKAPARSADRSGASHLLFGYVFSVLKPMRDTGRSRFGREYRCCQERMCCRWCQRLRHWQHPKLRPAHRRRWQGHR